MPPRHDVPRPSLNMDLFEAEIGGEAGLGTVDVAVHSCPIIISGRGRASDLKGGRLLCSCHPAVTDLLGLHRIR